MKELIGKMTLKSSNLPRKITVNKVDLFDQTKIAHEFNSFFTNIGKNLASKIPNASTPFEYFVNKSDFVMETKPLSMNELKEDFYSLKSNKSPGYDDNRLYKYLIENDILYSKQFGFQNSRSTDHALVQLVDQIIESSENNKYTLGVFIDLLTL